MSKFIVDLWLDGYENESDREKACEVFIEEQLNMTASSVKIEKLDESQLTLAQERIKTLEKILWFYDSIVTDCPAEFSSISEARQLQIMVVEALHNTKAISSALQSPPSQE